MDIHEVLSAGPVLSRHPWELARVEIVDLLLCKHAAGTVSGSDTVLDVGCGDAFVTHSLAVRYPDARFVGVDTALDEKTKLAVQGQIDAENVELYASLDAWDGSDGCVSAVLLMDVLEHIEDDESFLKEVASDRRVSEDAVFIVTVPAHQRLFSSHDTVLRHHRRYSSRRLTDTATAAGLDVIEAGYMFTMLLVPRLIESLIERTGPGHEKTESDVIRWRGGKTRTWACKTLLMADFRLARTLNKCGIRILGLSCYIVCKKSL